MRKYINTFQEQMIKEGLKVNDYIDQVYKNEYKSLTNELFNYIAEEGWLYELEEFYDREFDKNDFSYTKLNLTKEDKYGLINFDDDVIEKFNDFDSRLKSMDEYPFKIIDLIDYDNGIVYIIYHNLS